MLWERWIRIFIREMVARASVLETVTFARHTVMCPVINEHQLSLFD